MSGGMLLLTIAAMMTYCGLFQRVLDRMHLSDKQALFLIAVMLLGTFLPDITFGAVKVNVGGGLIPIGVCAYLFGKADRDVERWRTLWGIVLTGGSIYVLSALLPAEAETMPVDPIWLYGICGGIVAWIIGRSRRGAFVCGVAGVLAADIANAVVTWVQGYRVQLIIGGGGIADAAVISGIIGVMLCEILGETVERIVRACEKRGSEK